MDTNKMRSELRVSAERAIANNHPGGNGNPFPALAVRAVDVLALLAEIERLSTSRSKKERELEQELETWRHGPFCWTCGDTGDVHDITGEWRGECDCLSAQLINANRERDQLKAEDEALRTALSECIASLAGEMNQKYAGQKPEDMHPVTLRDYHRDIAELAGYRAAMAKEASHG